MQDNTSPQLLTWWSNLPVVRSVGITGKIWMGISLLVAGYALSTVVGYQQTHHQRETISLLSDEIFPATQLSQQAYSEFNLQAKYYNDAVVMGEVELLTSANSSSARVIGYLNQVAGQEGINPELADTAGKLSSDIKGFSERAFEVYTALSGFDVEEGIQQQAAALAEEQKTIQMALGELNESTKNLLLSDLVAMEAESRRNINISLAVFFIMLIASATVILSLIHI